MLTRRRVVFGMAPGLALGTIGAGARDASPEPPRTATIGVLNPTSGAFADFGEEVNAGIRLFFDGGGYLAGNAAIELLFADTAGDPRRSLDQARRLVQEERVDLLMGLVNSEEVLPVAELAGQEQTPLVVTIGGARAATGPDRNPYVFRTAMANGQQDRVLGWYAATALGKRRAATFAWDVLVGEERVTGFSETFTAAGGEIVAHEKPPLGTTDFGPFLDQLDPSAIDVLYAFFAGPGALAFVQQLGERRITPDLQIVAPDYFTAAVLDQMGDDALGLVQAGAYTAALDTPENQAFVAAYRQAGYAGTPGVYVEEGYLGAMVVAEAVRAAAGDKQALLDALAATNVVGPGGPLTFDERGQAVRACYLTRIEQSEAGVAQTLIETVDNVTRDWTP